MKKTMTRLSYFLGMIFLLWSQTPVQAQYNDPLVQVSRLVPVSTRL